MSVSLPIDILKKYKEGFLAFFETGTSEGDTVQTAVECGFDLIFSVELNEDKFERCRKRFIKSDRVSLMKGTSVDALTVMVPVLRVPTVFFLDAHPQSKQGATPVLDELDIIAKMNIEYMIFIDDINLMGTGKWISTTSIVSKLTKMGMSMIEYLDTEHGKGALLLARR